MMITVKVSFRECRFPFKQIYGISLIKRSMFKWPAWQFEFYSIFTVFVILLATLLAGKVSLKKTTL